MKPKLTDAQRKILTQPYVRHAGWDAADRPVVYGAAMRWAVTEDGTSTAVKLPIRKRKKHGRTR